MGAPTAETLRKVAAALREAAQHEEDERTKQAYLILKAAKGLTLLREKVRGT